MDYMCFVSDNVRITTNKILTFLSLSFTQMQIFMYNSDDFDSLNTAIREKRVIAAMAVFFQVRARSFPKASSCSAAELCQC